MEPQTRRRAAWADIREFLVRAGALAALLVGILFAMLALATLMYGKMPPWQCALAGCGLVLVLRALRLRKGSFGAV